MRKPRTPYHTFPLETLPPEVANFVSSSAAQVNCDPALVALPTLTLLASMVGNTRTIRLKQGWSEPCVLWSCTIGRPGSLKSPAYDQPLRHYNRWLFKQRIAAYKAEYVRCKFSKPFGSEPLTEWPYPDPLDSDPLLAGDITIDELTPKYLNQIRRDRPRGLLLARDELGGWITSFEGRRKNAVDSHKWFEMHRAGPLDVVRKSDGYAQVVNRAALSVTGTVHPETLQRALSRNNTVLPRLLMAWPPPKPRQWSDEPEDSSSHEAFDALIGRLLDLKFTRDEAGFAAPEEIKLSPEAKREWASFYNRNAQEIEVDGMCHGQPCCRLPVRIPDDRSQSHTDGILEAQFAKLEAYCARFALLLHVISGHTGAIQPETMRAAIQLTEWFKNEHRRIHELLTEAENRSLEEFIARRGGSVTANALRKSSRKYSTNAQAEEDLNALVAEGIGTWIIRAPTFYGGRPTREFKLNPGAGGVPAVDTETEVSEVSVAPVSAFSHRSYPPYSEDPPVALIPEDVPSASGLKPEASVLASKL